MIEPASEDFAAREGADKRLAEDADESDTAFRLNLRDLIPGKQGEVVLFNDSALPHVIIEAPQLPIESGAIVEYTTADDVDVKGFCFLRFDDGIIVFHDPHTRVVVETVTD